MSSADSSSQALTSPTGIIQSIGNLIRYWVHYDTTLTNLNKQVKQVRDARNAYEAQVLTAVKSANMTNPVIQIAGGRILVGEDRHSQPLTFKSLETHLHQYYRQRPGARDETADILKFIKSQREVTVTPSLRRVNNPAPAPQTN